MVSEVSHVSLPYTLGLLLEYKYSSPTHELITILAPSLFFLTIINAFLNVLNKLAVFLNLIIL